MATSSAGVTRGMKHVLIVEDEAHLAIGIKYNLEAEGYEVTTVADGLSALKLLEENPEGYDLIILDLMLPGMSGYSVCEAIRQRQLDLPVLMLSARTLVEDRVRGYDVGADQYLQKPFELEELLSITRRLINRGSRNWADADRSVDSIYEFGRAKVNFDTYEVSVAGKPVRLTTKEIKLLHHFVENEGSVLHRSSLLQK